jgi:peroxiredoxin
MLVFKDYNYDHFTREVLKEMEGPFSGPAPGDRAPDFKAVTLEGETSRLSDYGGKKNVLLLFGSATCPMTAASIRGINELYNEFRGDNFEFVLVYTREAHPGEQLPAHRSVAQKTWAARLLRDEEDLKMPVVVDDLRGSIHRKYSGLPNAAFVVDKSGRVAFRCKWATADTLAEAMSELLRLSHGRERNHVVVAGGQDLSMPLSYAALASYRALERGGKEALRDFHGTFGIPGEAGGGSHIPKAILQNPGRVLAIVALTTVVLTGGLYAGFELRKRRLGLRRNPYRAYEDEEVRDTDTGTDYGAVGI